MKTAAVVIVLTVVIVTFGVQRNVLVGHRTDASTLRTIQESMHEAARISESFRATTDVEMMAIAHGVSELRAQLSLDDGGYGSFWWDTIGWAGWEGKRILWSDVWNLHRSYNQKRLSFYQNLFLGPGHMPPKLEADSVHADTIARMQLHMRPYSERQWNPDGTWNSTIYRDTVCIPHLDPWSDPPSRIACTPVAWSVSSDEPHGRTYKHNARVQLEVKLTNCDPHPRYAVGDPGTFSCSALLRE